MRARTHSRADVSRGRAAWAAARALTLTVACAVLAGCGFQLQGMTELPASVETAHIRADDRYTDFHRALTDSLRVAGARLVPEPAAGTVIEVLREESGQRVLSVSARNTPREFEVFYSVTYRVRGGDAELIPPQTIARSREYTFDETILLAKEREQEIIREALARELAALVMRRLAALDEPAPSS